MNRLISSMLVPVLTCRELLCVALLSSLFSVIVFYTTQPTELNQGKDSDGVYYAAIAEQGISSVKETKIAPWAWRILTPLQARYLPLAVKDNFQLLALVSSMLILVLMYALLRASNLDRLWCFVGVSLYALNFWSIRFNFYSPYYVDHQSQLLLLLTLVLMLHEKFAIIPWVLALASFQKESIVFLVPVIFVYYGQKHSYDRNSKFYLLALLLPCLMVLGLLRVLIPPLNQYSPEAAIRVIFTTQVFDPNFWPRFLLEIFSGSGILLVLILMAVRSNFERLKRQRHWGVLLACGLIQLFSGWDKARLMLPMLPILVLLVVTQLQSENKKSSFLSGAWIVFILLLQAILGQQFVQFENHQDYLSRLVPVHYAGDLSSGYVRIAVVLIALRLGRFVLRLISRSNEHIIAK